MRNIGINIYPRANTNDNSYNFSSTTSASLSVSDNDVSSIYAFNSAVLNYSIMSSDVSSTLILTMNEPMTNNNVLRGGQPIIITENGNIVFQGELLLLKYDMLPIGKDGRGGMIATITLSPSIFQLTRLPMIFSPAQKAQIDNLLGIDTNAFLVGNATQAVSTPSLLDYMISNTDFNTIFNGTIQATLPPSIYLMASAGETRDSILRSSIDYTNSVFYQAEDGSWIIRQLDSTVKSPFIINIANSIQSDGFPGILSYSYSDNSAIVTAVVSNYNVIQAGLGIGSNAAEVYLSYKPNPKYFPRIKQLQDSGWFTGQLGHTPIGNNITSNASVAEYLNGLQQSPSQYVLSSSQSGASQNFIAAYQALLTGKEIGKNLTNYSTLACRISLDDQYLKLNTVNPQLLLGSCVDILNCDMESGLIAAYSRSYSNAGAFIDLNIVPLGSVTGYWIN